MAGSSVINNSNLNRNSSHFSHFFDTNAFENSTIHEPQIVLETEVLHLCWPLRRELLLSPSYMRWKSTTFLPGLFLHRRGSLSCFDYYRCDWFRWIVWTARNFYILFVINRSLSSLANENLPSLVLFSFNSWLKLDLLLTTSMLTLWREICG